MKTFRLLTGVVIASLFLLLGSCAKETTVGSIQGIVSNASNNEPIQGVNISLSPTGLSAVTGSDGRYEFTNLTAGQYTVQGVKKGYESNTKNITIVAGSISSGDMMLTPEISDFKLNVEYLDFGTAFSKLNFKIINTSPSLSISWSVTESLNWLTVTPSSGNLNAGQEISVMVDIDRSKIDQSVSANINVEANGKTIVLPVNVTVSGADGPQLQLSETSLDFGTSATSLAFYVMNTGPEGTSLNWTCSNVIVDWLTLTPTSGHTAGGASSPVMATIDRNKFDGVVSTSVTVSGAGSSSTITITASTNGSGSPILQLSEGSLNFGENLTSLTFLVKNVGSAGTVLDWVIEEPGVDWLTLSPMTGHTNSGSGTEVTAAVDRNKFTGTVNVTVRVNSQNNNASLSVTAVNKQPLLEVSTESLDFGSISTVQTFTVTNAGDEGTELAWNIAAPTVDWITLSPTNGNLNAGSSTTVTVTIDRTKFNGDVSTNLVVTAGSQTATVRVTATTAQATMVVTPTSVDFGKTSITQTITIKNEGEEGSMLNWTIANPTVAWLTVSPASGSLNANGSRVVTLTLDRSKFDGDVSTNLVITAGSQIATVSVTAATPVPTMTVNPIAVDFGKISTTQQITISNTGEAGSVLNYSIESPSVSWLTVSPASGTVNASTNAAVNLMIDRTAFTGVQNTNLHITGAGTTMTLPITVDNTILAANGLIAYYTFDDGTVSDWTGNYNGINDGATTSTDIPGTSGFSMEFNGATSYLKIPNAIFMSGTPWSYNVWFKTGQNNACLLSANAATVGSRDYFSFSSDSKLKVTLRNNVGSSTTWTTSSIASYLDNQWHMLTITYSGNTAYLYVDGMLLDTYSNSIFSWRTGIATTYIGVYNVTYNTDHYYYTGKMDNIRTYNRALTQAEVTALYNARQ